MAVRISHIRLPLALTFVLVAGLLAAPVRAQSTKDKLEAAQAKVADLRAEANQATVAFERAREKLILTQDEIGEIEDELQAAKGRIGRLQGRLNDRAREAYQLGPTNTLGLLLKSQSFSEFSDRLEFLDRLAQGDADLVTRVSVLSEELRRREARLAELEEEQTKLAAEAKKQQEIVLSKLSEAQDLEADLEAKYKQELAAQRAAAQAQSSGGGGGGGGSGNGSIPTVSGQALQACPAPGSSFTDTFGAPRSGGRSHQGVDMMGNYGMPIYAAQSGRVSHSSSSLGGNQAYVYSSSGYTFYAHLQGYSSASGNVSAGTLIGYMGDTGNATGNPHLHFEYHPGGGAAVNPTPYVAAVC